MLEENISQESRLKNMYEARNYFIKEINQNDLMSNQQKKICMAVNYIEHLLISTPALTGCVSISAFASLVGISIGITSSAVGLEICAITAQINDKSCLV